MSFYLLLETGDRLLTENGDRILLEQAPADVAYFVRRFTHIFLAEIEAYDPATETTKTWLFASGSGFDKAGDFYTPRMENPATFSRSMSGISGRAGQSFGELTLLNPDNAIAALGEDFFDGRTLTLKWGDRDGTYSSFQTILTATIETLGIEKDRLSFRLRDKAITLDQPFATVKYAGSNALPLGVEGTPDDIQDQIKPRLFGRIALMQPVLVNTAKLIYQVNEQAVDAVLNVFDGGAYLTKASDYNSLSDLYAFDPPAGQWRAFPPLGLIRLGSTPINTLSVSVVEKWDHLQNTAAGLIQRILTEKGVTNWVSGDFTTLNQKNAGSIGIVVEGEETTASLLDRICASVGAWWGFDALGRFRVARFEAPSGSPVATLTDDLIIDAERQPETQLPFWSVKVTADVNHAVQDKNGLAGVVTEARAAWLKEASREQKAENATVKNTRLLADEITYDTSLNGISIAQAEAARRLNLYAVRRDVVNLTLANPQQYYTSLDLGAVVNLASTRLGYGTGRLMTVTRVGVDYQTNTIDLTLWG
jgi:hypothetical protein